MRGPADKSLLRSPGFAALLVAQFTGALNDNTYRMTVSLFALAMPASEGGSAFVSLAGLLFILPYLVFSGWAGKVADRFDRSRLLATTKLAELAIMTMAMGAFWLRSIELMLAVLLLMAAQSTFFSPVRYGILPEIVARRDVSRANGVGEMSMYGAILLGTALGGLLFEWWHERFYLVAVPLVAISAIGVAASVRVRLATPALPREAPPSGSGLMDGLRLLRTRPALGAAVGVLSLLWGVGAMLQLDILFFGRDALSLREFAVGLLQSALGLGIGLGCLLAGWLSGGKVRPGLARLGVAGVVLSLLVLGAAPVDRLTAFTGILVTGLCGGLIIVPMISFLHDRSTPDSRGRVFAINNFLNMAGVLAGIAAFYGLHDGLAIGPDRVLLAIGLIALLGFVACGLVDRLDCARSTTGDLLRDAAPAIAVSKEVQQ